MDLNISKYLPKYTINLLNKQNIVTVVDFIKADTCTLTKVTNLELEAITKLKNDFLCLLRPVEGFGFECEIIKTGIDR